MLKEESPAADGLKSEDEMQTLLCYFDRSYKAHDIVLVMDDVFKENYVLTTIENEELPTRAVSLKLFTKRNVHQ